MIVRSRAYGRAMSETISWLLGLSGYALVAVICGLIVLEELGIPIPFMPGDFLLFVAGASIATGHVNPFVMVTAAYVSALIGALGGREVFLRIGSAMLPRVAALLHAGDRVDRLTAKLRRSGSAAVFLGRITPGMRINTTYLSGLVAMPRRTFLVGLAPAIAVYEAVFIGLGAWLGKPAWGTIEQYSHKPAVLLVLVTAIGLAFIGHAIVNHFRRRAASAGTRVMPATMASRSSSSA